MAARNFHKALEIQPDDRDALYWLGFVYAWAGRTDAARLLVARLLEVDPLTPANYWIVGAVEMVAGRFDAAADAFQTLMDKDPKSYMPFYFLANVLARAGRIDETASLRESVHALAPGGFHANIGNVYERAESGDVDGVRAALTPELEELSTWHLGVAGDLASACANAGATEEALD